MKAIVLTRGRIASVSDRDFNRVNEFKWFAIKSGRTYYGARTVRLPDGRRRNQLMHNFILGVKGVDHRDGDGLENCRGNLRVATQQQNLRGHRRKAVGTTSSFRGVFWDAESKRWRAKLGVGGKHIYLGRFKAEEAAARSYDIAARKHYGKFASPNFPC